MIVNSKKRLLARKPTLRDYDVQRKIKDRIQDYFVAQCTFFDTKNGKNWYVTKDDDDPLKISKAIHISKKCIRIVYENIYFAIGIKIICLVLGALGIANMWAAIFADVGVMVIAVLNAIRALNAGK